MVASNESTFRTLAVAAGVALFCSLLVSTAVSWLRPMQLAYRAIEQNRAIVEAAGEAPGLTELSNREVVSQFVRFDTHLVDLDSGNFAQRNVDNDYDYRGSIDNPELHVEIEPGNDQANLGSRPRLMPVYIRQGERGIDVIVLPMYGPGMWSTIHGVLGLGADLQTITGIRFYEHGETPGIGDRIQDVAWTGQWVGKRIVSGSDQPEGLEQIDSITGATVTVSAVEKFVAYWLSDDGYGRFLTSLQGEVQ